MINFSYGLGMVALKNRNGSDCKAPGRRVHNMRSRDYRGTAARELPAIPERISEPTSERMKAGTRDFPRRRHHAADQRVFSAVVPAAATARPHRRGHPEGLQTAHPPQRKPRQARHNRPHPSPHRPSNPPPCSRSREGQMQRPD